MSASAIHPPVFDPAREPVQVASVLDDLFGTFTVEAAS